MTKLFILHEAAEKIRQYTALCPDEISGIGKVIMEKGVLTVTDVEIFKQTVSGAHSTIEPESLAEFQSDIVKKGGSMKQYVLWWHSHAHMGVFFSGTDTDTIENSSEFPYLVSLVVNKKGDAKARLDYYTPIHGFTELEVEVEKIPESKVAAAIRVQIDALEEKLKVELKKGNEKIKDLCQKEIDKKIGKRKWGWNRGSDDNRDYGDFEKSWGKGDKEWEKDLRADYWKEKTNLLGQVKYLEDKGGQKEEGLLGVKRKELAEHIQYGLSMGYEVRRIQTTNDK